MANLPSGKARVTITVSSDMDTRLQRMADLYGVTKSALCALYIGQVVTSAERALGAIDSIGTTLSNETSQILKTAAADPMDDDQN